MRYALPYRVEIQAQLRDHALLDACSLSVPLYSWPCSNRSTLPMSWMVCAEQSRQGPESSRRNSGEALVGGQRQCHPPLLPPAASAAGSGRPWLHGAFAQPARLDVESFEVYVHVRPQLPNEMTRSSARGSV